MPIPNSIALSAAAAREGLDSVLVGGNAVNLYAYRRTTFDVDLLIRESDAAQWRSFLQRNGFDVFHATGNFIRMRLAADPAGALPIDLMLADEQTFQKIFAERRTHDLGNGITVAVPHPLHLVAMKLHALRSPHRVADGIDLQDVIHLITATGTDINSRAFTEILDRYASPQIRDEIRRHFGEA